MKKQIQLLLCIVALGAAAVRAEGPAWWSDRGVVDTNQTANDYALVTLGQLKWIATNACAEMAASFAPGANITALIAAFSNANNYYLANLGQLKYVAQPFYDRLNELGLTNTLPANMPGTYPWGNGSETNDYALAAIGQVKYVFSFDSSVDTDSDGMSDWEEAGWNTDTDGDGMSDAWEIMYELDPNVNDAARDADGDGVGNLDEYHQGRDPRAGTTSDTNSVVNLKVYTALE